MPFGQPSNRSHCVPGAISNGPCSGLVSTAVRLKASEFSRRPSGGRLGHGEVAMPGLVGGAGEGNVEADLDDPVVGAEHSLADRDEPGMGDDLDEAADPLGLDLDIEALRPARQGAARNLPRFLEQRLDILAHPVGEAGAEGALAAR